MPRERLGPRKTVQFLRRLVPRVRPHWTSLFGASLLLLISTAVGLAFPLVVRFLLDAAFLAGDARMLNRITLGLLGLFVFQAFVNFGQSYLTASVSERVVATLRRDVFKHLLYQPPGYFARRRVGKLTSRIASDAGLVQNVIRFGVPEIVRQGVFLVGALVLVTITHPRLTLVTLVAAPFTVIVGYTFGRRVRRITTGIQDRLAEAVARAEQVFTQVQTVQSFAREDLEEELFAIEINATRDAGLKRAVARAALTGAITFAAFGAIVLMLWQGGQLVLSGDLTPGTLVAFLLYAVTIAGAVSALAGFYSNLQEAAGAARRIFEILDEPHELTDPPDPVPLPELIAGRVRYEDVHFRYGEGLPWVLQGINATVEPGETVALVGVSGAGKSTMASLLPRFFDTTGGRVCIDGVDVSGITLRDLRSVIGLVPQEPMLFAGTVRLNLAYGRPDATDEEIEAAARAAHAHEFIVSFPDGYGQQIGERGVTLSAGQRQRIAIARVMLKNPPILILDEASSSLDAESEAFVQDALDHLMAERTTLVIAHRLSTVLRADRILVLEDGRIQADGRHADLLERSETYSRLYRRQFEDTLATTMRAAE